MVSGQNSDKKKTRIKLDYVINYDKSEGLLANIKIREDRLLPLSDATIQFYCIGDTSEYLLGEVLTDSNGDALLIIKHPDDVYKDEDRYMTFEVIYEGEDLIAEGTADIMVKQSNMDLSFFQKDSVKNIKVEVYELTTDEGKIPIEDAYVMFYIKGTFSSLNFAEESTDENGIIIVPFPEDMPGDTAGLLTIVTKIEENDDYGIIEARETINWGIPVPLEKLPNRGLGDTDAPLWMVYTLIILLSAVWFHYLYVIYLIIKIKMARLVYS
jgi:hypothetical protein